MDQVESLQTGYGCRVSFVDVDYLANPPALSEHGISDGDFTFPLPARQQEAEECSIYARFMGNLHEGTFSLTAIRDSLETLLNAEGS